MSSTSDGEGGGADRLDDLARVADVIAGVAHDLNNPLAGILGYCHLLRLESDPTRIRKFVTHIREQAEACRDLIGGLQECVVGAEARPRRFAIQDLVDGMVMFESVPGVATGEVVIDTDIEPGLEAYGDADQWRRALSRLVANSVAAIGGAGRVIIRADTSVEGCVSLLVCDDGPGFVDHVRGRAFDPTVTSRRSGSGVGLGLPIALSIARRNGGDVRIVSWGPGGTRVALDIPTREVRDGARMLCLDDDSMVLELYQDMSELLGVSALSARTAAEAVDLMQRNSGLELMVCDFNLPDATAEAVYVAFRDHLPKARFVLCTGAPNRSDVMEMAERYGLEVMAKPFTVDDLRRLLG